MAAFFPREAVTVALCCGLLLGCAGSGGQVGSALVFPEDAMEAAAAGEGLIVDVRLARESRDPRVADAGAVGIPFDPGEPARFVDAVRALADGDASRDLLLICEVGVRSEQARRVLAAHGFARVRSIDQGYGGWRAAGLPLRQRDAR